MQIWEVTPAVCASFEAQQPCLNRKNVCPQLKLGYKMKAGHRAFRRLRLVLEASGCVKEVIGKVDDKPVVCIRWTTLG